MNVPVLHRAQPLRAALLVLLTALLLSACASRRHQEVTTADTPLVMAHDTLDYDSQRELDALFLEAKRQYLKGNGSAAYQLLRAAYALNPTAAEVNYELGRLHMVVTGLKATEHRELGETYLRRAIALAPDNVDYKEGLINIYGQQGRYDEAAALSEQLVNQAPTVERLGVLASLQEEVGNDAGAIRSLKRLETLEGKNEKISVEIFRLYAKMGDNARAYAAIEDLCAEYPDDLRYRVLLGDLYKQNGYNEMALAIYRDVLTAEPNNGYAQLSLLAYYHDTGADSLYRRSVREVVLNPAIDSDARDEAMRGYVEWQLTESAADRDEVLDLFRQVLQQPQDNHYMAALCADYVYVLSLPDEESIPLYRSILAAEPDFLVARQRLAGVFFRNKSYADLVDVCHEGHLYSPDVLLFYYLEGASYTMLDADSAALAAFKEGVDYLDDNVPTDNGARALASQIYGGYGDLINKPGGIEVASSAYEQALQYDANNAMVLNNYAYLLCRNNRRLDYAAALSRRSLEAEPDNASYLDTYAAILVRQRQYAQARTYIDRALEQLGEDNNSVVLERAGDIYYYCRQRNAALKFWIRALAEAAPTDDNYAALQRKVRQRRP